MKKFNLFIFLFIATFLVSSCYEEEIWVDDNVTTEGKHFPVIATLSIDSEGPYTEGSQVDMTLFYWSIDPIKEVTLSVDSIVIDTKPYASNFDDIQQTDKISFSYTVPNGTVAGTEILLDFQVINENGLTREKSTSVTTE